MDSKYAEVNTTEADQERASRDVGPQASQHWRKSDRWKLSVRLGFLASVLAFLLNLAVLVWTLAGDHASGQGISIIYTGSCELVRNVSILVHVAINILSSLLLAASNNCMQVLSAPTRAAIDQAHSRRKRLDVGVQTARNLTAMDSLRRWLWVLLAVSSLPLHLFYNSILIESKVVNDYAMVLGSAEFLTGGFWNSSRADNCFNTGYGQINNAVQYLQNNADQLKRLDNADCIAAYSADPISLYGNVLLVTDAQSNDSVLNVLYIDGQDDADGWLCNAIGGTTCNPSNLDPLTWKMPGTTLEDIPISGEEYSYPFGGLLGDCEANPNHNFPVSYCMAQPAAESCTLGIAPVLLGVVLICNAIKAACLFWSFSRLSINPLVTLGDAIDSFLQHPDPATAGFGVYEATSESWGPSRKPWQSDSRSGFSAASGIRWVVASILFVGFWCVCIGLLTTGLNQWSDLGLNTSWAGITSNGLGHVNPNELVDNTNFQPGLIANSVIANVPQLLISILYILYNDLLTRMLLAKEWAAYALSHQPLRVTHPRGQQVGSHFLSLPWKFAIPFIGALTALHWLVSQSIFLAYMTGTDYGQCSTSGVPQQVGVVTLGVAWSPFALILSLIVGGALILLLWILGCAIHYKGSIPLVRSSSVAISAACHPAHSDEDAALRLVKYGVLDERAANGAWRVGFSSGPVGPLATGQVYA